MKKTLAMILAGGRGRRMDIFCQQRPKPILPFGGNFHVIDFTLSNCINSQTGGIAILVDYQRSVMTEYLSQWSLINKPQRFSILQPKIGSFSGTANAVYQNMDYIKRQGCDRVLVLAGDHIYNMDYREMLSFHQETRADVTVAVTRVPIDQAHRFGTVSVSTGGQIQEFVEKSSNPRSNLASMGIYIFNTDFLKECLEVDAGEPNSAHDFGYAILPRIVKKNRISAYEFKGYWQDIGTVEAYYEANLRFLGTKSSFNIDNNWPVLAGSPVSPASARNNGSIVNSLISPGCVIEGYVENSILSPGVRVEEGAQVINSVIMADTSIGYHSIVERCILDEKVKIGRFCYVGFCTGMQAVKPGITLVGRNVNVPHLTVIGCKSKILPDLSLSALNKRLAAPGSIVSVPA